MTRTDALKPTLDAVSEASTMSFTPYFQGLWLTCYFQTHRVFLGAHVPA
jgi:hypothetical protein